jgi:geranylgeranylglycerol-phosphate geranylgeranyltransferase
MQNCLIASLAVAVGQYLSPATTDLPLNPFTMAAAFFVCAFGNIINDILDIDSDQINHPHRVLPSGRLSMAQARTLAFLFLIVSLGLVFVLDIVGGLIVVIAIILVTWYNIKLKHTAYWGNVAVSILGSMTFILGGTIAGFEHVFVLPGAIIPAVFAFLMHFGREIVKDIEDRSGDAKAGSNTAPVRSGSLTPLIIVYLLFGLLTAASLFVYFVGWYNITYLYITIGFIYLPLAGQLIWLGFHPDSKKCHRVSVLIKLQMLPGIIALVVRIIT